MINPILEFSVRQRMLVILGSIVVTGFGVLALRQIPIDAFPDVTNVQVQVLATAGGMSPPEVEKLVTRPLEWGMSGLPRLEEMRSVSKIGLCAITIVFKDGTDDYFARQLVSERLQALRDGLPAGVDVQLGPITTGLGEIFQYTLVSKNPKYDATELRTVQDYIVRPILRTVPGVTDVNSFGGLVKQYQVIVKPDRLTSLGVTLAQVFEALEKNNSNASGNFIEHESEQYVVRGIGLVQDMRDIENIIVAVQNHTPIYIRDVASVKIGAELRQGAVTANGEGEAVAGIVLMLKGASGRDVVNAVKEKLPSIQKALPKGVELVPFYDRTDLVKKAIHTVTKALAEGAVFVLIVLIVLLADVRSALIVTLILPLAALFAFIMMKWYGLSANLMSLGGSRHRHRDDGRWRGRDGGKHSSASDRAERPGAASRGRQNRNRPLRGEGSRPPDCLRHLHHHPRLSPALHSGRFRGKNVQPARFYDFFRTPRIAHLFAHTRADALHLFSQAETART